MNKLIKPAEAAEYLGVSPRTLANARAKSSPPIPFVRIGASVRYSIEALDIYILQNTKKG
jgi:hypothetical protein|tara:strand:+ start:420 stop:599 length:180 start_codon:yes stop_codon:yes gene_type:complete